ncbi:UNVERIFIED_CONTAM: hypothetical protein HDU68_008927 [Siphonaria sp. JEL0065]|nr:hypothetical protein HDU68_008927 [Siphonaria sp. JEL0065]
MALGIPALTPTPDATTFWFFLALMGLAMSDVIADAMVVRQAREADVSAAMNFWKKDIIDIGADKKAYIDTVGDIFGIAGLVLYTKYFKKTKFSMIFFVTQVFVAVFAMSDVVLAMMSIGNIGGNIGTMYGGYLLEALHIVKTSTPHNLANNGTITLVNGTIIDSPPNSIEEYDFTNLPLFLWIRVASMAASAFFVFAMVPNKPEEVEKKEGEEEEVMGLVGREGREDLEDFSEGGGKDSLTSISAESSTHKRSASKRRTRSGANAEVRHE